ncbi:hypothetical protein PHMEG_00024090 [Phytophthora megakarya]|uniref:Uncharacterized protein n=1 Tax=Phytophthora megakarya TaxID=4795 RepID=A0A225VG28_9STRA|nr:hypothetical protein PHMEG_00024090 [Phytophthora megakarya]
MVRQVSFERISVPPLKGRGAAGQDAGLVPNLLAAAAFLRSPKPSSPTAPLVVLAERPPEAQGHVDINLASSRGASPHADHADEEKEEWEDDDNTDPWAAINLIRASLAITERPPLPPPPKRHPSATWWNHFNPEAEVDTEADYNIRKLIDRWGKPGYVAYLLSWEWPENLKSVYWCIDQSGRCFLHAFQAACSGLGKPGLVYRDHWDRFCVSQGNYFPDGVVPEDIDKFFNFVRAERVPLDYVELFKVSSHMALSSTAVLDREARNLPPGHYIVHAAQDLVEHCFTLVVTRNGSTDPIMVYDGFLKKQNPPCWLEPLEMLEWITKIYSMCRVALARPKRPTKPKKKN